MRHSAFQCRVRKRPFATKRLSIASAALLLALGSSVACGATQPPSKGQSPKTQEQELNGIPFVVDSHTIMLGGRTVTLWGLSPLASDQQCWRGPMAWSCGEQATIALKHFIEDRPLSCRIKTFRAPPDFSSAQCFRQKRGNAIDIASYLVQRGWAMDAPTASGGLYANDQDDARAKQRGIWCGKFQTDSDWREGTQRFIDSEKGEPGATPPPPLSADQPPAPGPASPEPSNDQDD